MTTKQHEQAYKEAEKEIAQERIYEIKEFIKSILQKIEDEKSKKEKAEEAIRLLKLDLDDLRQGKLEKIRERHDKSKIAAEISPLGDTGITKLIGYSDTVYLSAGNSAITTTAAWTDATSGTYTVATSSGSKEYYF